MKFHHSIYTVYLGYNSLTTWETPNLIIFVVIHVIIACMCAFGALFSQAIEMEHKII